MNSISQAPARQQATSNNTATLDRQEIRRALEALTVPGQTFEIRAIVRARGARSRICHSIDEGVEAAVEFRGAKGTYFTLNPLRPDLDAEAAAKDKDVVRRRLILVDVDAVRPAAAAGDQNATDDEKRAAIELARLIRGWLIERGFPAAILIDSGNGGHLDYLTDLPNDDASRDLVRAFLDGLAMRFDTERAKVDTTVFNAARISKLPGTMVRKGPESAERPHRPARLLDVPPGNEIVTREILEAIAAKPAVPEKPRGRRAAKAGAGPPGDYGRGELRREIDRFGNARHPGRHAELLRCSMSLAGLVKAGAIDEREVVSGLHSAARDNGLEAEGRLPEIDAAWRSAMEKADARILPGRVAKTRGDESAEGLHSPRLSADGDKGGTDPSADGDGQQEDSDPVNLTEWGNAKRLIAVHGAKLRYCKPLGYWLEWDGMRWCPDHTGAIWRWAKDAVRLLGREAAEIDNSQRRQATLRWALKSEEKKVLAAMIELAWSEKGIAIMPDQLDVDPWVLNTPSGTVDLKSGKLNPHRQQDLISKITAVRFDPKAKCPRWEKVLREIFGGDDDMVAYVQRAIGYSVTGVIGEHALFLCHGTGRNGKNTVLDTVQTILGDYATVANPRTFLAIGQNDHLAMVADLMGRRFVPTDEVEEGDQLAESMVKRLTGNKTLKARFMHKNPFQFPVLFKIWMLANCKPEIQGQDEGIWSRIRLISFDVFFPPESRIKGLSETLIAEEGPGILKWMVDGCLEWQRIGLAEPKRVLDAINDYRSEQNILMDFIGQCCDSFLESKALREKARTKTGVLYDRYVAWCKENGEKKVLTSRKFGLKLTPLGYNTEESNGACYRLGLLLKDREDVGENG